MLLLLNRSQSTLYFKIDVCAYNILFSLSFCTYTFSNRFTLTTIFQYFLNINLCGKSLLPTNQYIKCITYESHENGKGMLVRVYNEIYVCTTIYMYDQNNEYTRFSLVENSR